MTILVCSNGQSHLQDKQQSLKQGTSSTSSLNFKDREPPTWRLEKIELEKQLKEWKKKYDDLQEEIKKAPTAVAATANVGRAEADGSKVTLDAVSCLVSACSLLCAWQIEFCFTRKVT